MPEEKRQLKVFLCHAHADRNTVHELYACLIQDGVDAWLDKEKLLPGQDWELEIRKAVREADVVIVCISKQFNQAGFRQKEVRLVLDTALEQPEGEIFIVPARLEECDALESLRKWHWVNLFEDDGYEMLMRALRARADKIGASLQLKSKWLYKATAPIAKIGEEKSSETSKPIPEKVESSETKLRHTPTTTTVVVLMSCLGITIAALVISPLSKGWFAPAPIPSETATATATMNMLFPAFPTNQPVSTTTGTIEPSLTPSAAVPTITLAPTFTLSPTPLLTQITDAKGVPMMLVPAGEFIMGTNDHRYWESGPQHQVYLDAFYMDKYEVTNGFYKICVDAGKCAEPKEISSRTRPSYYGDSAFDNYPVIYVDWYQAKAYCEWRDARLPTEAEWEKAARGTDGRTYPWGEEIDCTKANYWGKAGGCVGDTTLVGIYEDGKSSYGIHDLGGNVWEWVADWFGSDYQNSPSSNPRGPDSGSIRVLRGSSWGGSTDVFIGNQVNSALRLAYDPTHVSDLVGIRCAKNANP